MQNITALNHYLIPLNEVLADPSVSEILINQPGLMAVERGSCFELIDNSSLTLIHLMGLANLISSYSGQRLSENEPLLSAHLPEGHRVQVVLAPATSSGKLIISIRKQTIKDTTLEQYQEWGTFAHTKPSRLQCRRPRRLNEEEEGLNTLYRQGNYPVFLKEAVKRKKNILISGGTSTGKTSLLNACLKEIPLYEHLITLEDVAELKPPHRLHTALFASKGGQGMAKLSMQDLVQASLRLRPDRIIMGEMRGAEAADFINATSTGHDGSLSSVHAASPEVAFMRLVHMVKLGGTNLSRDDILDDLDTVIDIIVQVRRRVTNDRIYREISEIYYANAQATS